MMMKSFIVNTLCWLLAVGTAHSAELTNVVDIVKAAGGTNDVKAVEAMAVVEGKESSEAEEAAEVAEVNRRREVGKEAKKTVEADDPWDSFRPPPDSKYDWLQLISGEWLKGDFKVLYDRTVEFDSDELDLLEFDFEDVLQLRTRGMQTVFVQGEGGRRDTAILRGVLEMNEGEVTLRRSEHEVVVPRDKVISIAGGNQRERDYWSGMVSIGLNFRGGNTETADTTVMANVMRRTAATRLNVDYLANYSRSLDVATADNQRLSGFYDRFLTSKLYWKMIAGEFYRDPFSNIDQQYSLSTGAGYDFIHTSKTEWGLDLGVGYQNQKYVSVEEGRDDASDSPFATFGTRFDREVNSKIDFLFDYSMRWLNEENGKYTHHMLTTLSTDLIKDLDLDVTLVWDRIDNPQTDADGNVPKQDDYQLVVSLAYDF